jgi:aspartate racemase
MKVKCGKKIIGILGGMGPQASAYMYSMLIMLSQKYFGAKNNNDFPEIILHSMPVPDFISDSSKREVALEILRRAVIQLNNSNLLCLAIACNTVHVLLKDLQPISRAPFVSIIDEVVNQISKDKLSKVGLLATPSTIKYFLYQKALKSSQISVIIPSKKQQGYSEKIIRNVLKGKLLKSDTERLVVIANSLMRKGAEGIILGCTELPLIFPKKYSSPVYNSVEILAMALLQKNYKQNTI